MTIQVSERSIRGVSPLFVEDGEPWSCSHCGVLFPRAESWLASYCHADGDQYAFVVCRDCAAELAPATITIDLTALESLPGGEPAAEIESLVRFIADRRGDAVNDAIAIRWMDLDVLASTSQMTMPEFLDWLRLHGLVRERRTAPRRGEPRS